MMFYVIGTGLYTWCLILVLRRITDDIILIQKNAIEQAQVFVDARHKEKNKLEDQVKKLEVDASRVFTLYDMTREITRRFDEEEAFSIFQARLAEHVVYEKCILLDPLSDELKDLQSNPDYWVFTLKGKRRLLGYLALSGLHDEQRETATVLVNQFALALRRIRLYTELEKSAITDSLTDVHTRRYILERLDEELKRASMRRTLCSLLMIDVDHFKQINDQHGHLTGDRVLHDIAKMIKENIREIDIVGRYGGEEFCVILPDTGADDAVYVAERIRAAVDSTEIHAYDAQIKSTVSIGLATFPNDAEKNEELLDKADWAMYRAKKLGRNQICIFGVYPS